MVIIKYNQKFSPGENYCQFCHPLSLAKKISTCELFSDCIGDMVKFTVLAKANYSCSTKLLGLGEIFDIRYSDTCNKVGDLMPLEGGGRSNKVGDLMPLEGGGGSNKVGDLMLLEGGGESNKVGDLVPLEGGGGK